MRPNRFWAFTAFARIIVVVISRHETRPNFCFRYWISDARRSSWRDDWNGRRVSRAGQWTWLGWQTRARPVSVAVCAWHSFDRGGCACWSSFLMVGNDTLQRFKLVSTTIILREFHLTAAPLSLESIPNDEIPTGFDLLPYCRGRFKSIFCCCSIRTMLKRSGLEEQDGIIASSFLVWSSRSGSFNMCLSKRQSPQGFVWDVEATGTFCGWFSLFICGIWNGFSFFIDFLSHDKLLRVLLTRQPKSGSL